MALSADVHWRIIFGGLETNGGGFDPTLTGGMLTDGTVDSNTGNTAAPVFSSASYNFVAGDVGKMLFIGAGTNCVPGWYPIASVASNKATLTASIDTTLGGARKLNGWQLVAAGISTIGTPTGITFSIDYSSSTTPFLSITDLVSTASTTITSVAALFTPVMVGNILRLASATGSPVADSGGSRYLALTTYTNSSTMVADKTSGTYTLGIAKVGGAHLHILTYANGGAGTAPVLTTPLLAGHIIDIKGDGANTPGSATFDWSDSYWAFPDGSATTGIVRPRGYNGRPRIDHCGLVIFNSPQWRGENICWFHKTASFTTYGPLTDANLTGNCSHFNCRFDQNGIDATQITGRQTSVDWCEITNSGTQSAGTVDVISTGHVWTLITNCYLHGLRGPTIGLHASASTVHNTIISGNNSDGIKQYADDSTKYGDEIRNCTIDGNAGHGINYLTGGAAWTRKVNNIISNHTGGGKYGENFADAQAVNERLAQYTQDYNFYWANTNNFNNFRLQQHDVQLTADPFTNQAGADFSLNSTAGGGAAVQDVAFATTVPGSSTRNYADGGAVEHQTTAGSSGILFIPDLAGT